MNHTPRRTDLTEQIFNRWTVIEFSHKGRNRECIWTCKCQCGKIGKIQGNQLTSGRSKSCGCLMREIQKQGRGKFARHPLYRTWYMMIQRCTIPTSKGYEHYGGRGVTVCDRWRFGDGQQNGVKCFIDDMGERPLNHTLERKDNDGNYEPSNCCWASPIEQHNNRRTNITLTFQGKTLTIAQWARELNVHVHLLRSRYKHGWSVDEMLTRPSRKQI